MSDELMRENFELHMYRKNICTRLSRHPADNTYKTISVQRAWELWQAALATQPQAPQGAVTRPVLIDVDNERKRQDEKWGGANHDDSHEVSDFVQLIEDYAGWARTMAGMSSYDKARRRLIQVAALAVACCESLDRATPTETPEEQK